MTIEEHAEKAVCEMERLAHLFGGRPVTRKIIADALTAAVAEHNEQCAKVADPGEWEDWMDVDDEAAAAHKGAMRIMSDIRRLLKPTDVTSLTPAQDELPSG